MAGIPRRHHFVTKAYLEGFVRPNEKQLCCYGRKKPEPFQTTPDNLANSRDYYSFKRADGTIDYSLEKQIGEEIESPGLPVIAKLAAGKVNLSHAERIALARFIALQCVRVPFERDFLDVYHRDSLLSYLSDMDEDSRRLGRPVNTIQAAVTSGNSPRLIDKWVTYRRADLLEMLRELEADPGKTSRETLMGVADTLAAIMARMQWTLFVTDGNNGFITSDRPVIMDNAYQNGMGRGLKNLRTTVTFPLTSRASLLLTHRNWVVDAARKRPMKASARSVAGSQSIVVLHVNDGKVHNINLAHAAKAHLWVFSESRQDWLSKWASGPLNAPKRALQVLEVDEDISTHRKPAVLTRKREFVVNHG